MSDEQDFFCRVMKVFAKHDNCSDAFWHQDLSVFVSCNDLFCWASADAEDIETEEDLDLLNQAYKDDEIYGSELFCARKGKMRPQGAFYKNFSAELTVLMNAAGPEREIDLGNPQDQTGNYLFEKE